jgi:hypothetical protein
MSEIDPNRCPRCGGRAGADSTWHNGCVSCADDDDEKMTVKKTIREEYHSLSKMIERIWRKHGRDHEYDHSASLEAKLWAIGEALDDKSNLIQFLRLKLDEENDMSEKTKNDNEVYHGMIGKVFGRYWIARSLGDDAEGNPGQVGFNWKKIDERETSHGDIVGFYHTHPHCAGQPSSTDYKTMGTWTVSFGRPLLCLIEGTDGLNANWFKDDETRHAVGKVRKFGKWYLGTVPRFK